MRAFSLSFILLAAVAMPARADDLDPLAKAIDDRPDDKANYDAYAIAAFKAKKFDDAIKRLKNGVARIPDYGEGYYKLAYAFRQKKEWADAADYYRRYIALNPQKTDPYFGLGAALEGLGDKKGAIAAYDKYVSLEKAPEKQRFVDQAKSELVKLDPSRAPAPPLPPPPAPKPVVAQLPPPPAPVQPAGPPRADATALRQTADQLRKDGKLDEAAAAYQKAIDADRGNVDLYNELGNCYFGLKRYNEAAQAFRDATARDASYALGWYNLAHALRKGDKKSEAVTAYRQYIRLKPDDPDPYYGLGQTLKALGDIPGAIDAFRKYVGMEKRPDEQRWVDKARAELEMLEAMQRSSPGPSGSSGKIEEKDAGDDLAQAASQRLQRELDRDRLAPLQDDGDGLMNPFDRRPPSDGLRDPFDGRHGLHDLKDPFGRQGAPAPGPQATRRVLREYELAIEAYRRALNRHVEDVSARYQRGVDLALNDDTRGATRAWNGVPLIDTRVDAARKGIEHVREILASRK